MADDNFSDDEYDDWLSAIDENSVIAYERGSFLHEDPIDDLTSAISSISITTDPTTTSSSPDSGVPLTPTVSHVSTSNHDSNADQTAYAVSSQMFKGQTEDW